MDENPSYHFESKLNSNERINLLILSQVREFSNRLDRILIKYVQLRRFFLRLGVLFRVFSGFLTR